MLTTCFSQVSTKKRSNGRADENKQRSIVGNAHVRREVEDYPLHCDGFQIHQTETLRLPIGARHARLVSCAVRMVVWPAGQSDTVTQLWPCTRSADARLIAGVSD